MTRAFVCLTQYFASGILLYDVRKLRSDFLRMQRVFSPYSMCPGWSCMLQSYISFQRQVSIAFSCNSYFFVSFYYIIYV
jgi:hypothetical protein